MIMKNEERDRKIENFLKKWDEVMKAADEIPDFILEFEVSVTSDNSLIEERLEFINGINSIFTKHNRRFISSNYYLKD